MILKFVLIETKLKYPHHILYISTQL